MRKRNIHIQFWLDKKEAEHLNKMVKRSGLSREVYLRHIISGLVPTDAPPPDYYAMMRELHQISEQLSQREDCGESLTELRRAIREISNAVMLPRKL
jgi:hypothetical protein